MKISIPTGTPRFMTAVIAAFTLTVVPALAAPNAVAKLGNKSFGNGASLSATSTGTVNISPQYYYSLQGSCEGTGDMAKIAPKGTSLATLLNSFRKGISAGLVGVVPPPKAPSKSSVIELPVSGSRTVAGLGKVTLKAVLRCEVQPTGKVIFTVNKVEVRNAAGLLKGVIRMQAGSSLTVTAPARIVFKSPAFSVAEDAGVVNIVLSRTNFLNSTVTVKYSTQDARAVAPLDYIAVVDGSVTFAPGQKEATIPITIVNNPLPDADRIFRISLTSISSQPQGAFLGDRILTSVKILNQ